MECGNNLIKKLNYSGKIYYKLDFDIDGVRKSDSLYEVEREIVKTSTKKACDYTPIKALNMFAKDWCICARIT